MAPASQPNHAALADELSLPVPALLKSHQVSTLGYAFKVVEHRWPTLGTKATSILGASGNLLATRATDVESTKACRATEHFHSWGWGWGGKGAARSRVGGERPRSTWEVRWGGAGGAWRPKAHPSS